MIHGHSESSTSFVEPGAVTSLVTQISVIRDFGAVWAWPDLCGCTGTTLGVEVGVGTGVTFGMAVGVETGTTGFGSGVTSATNCGVHWMVVAGLWHRSGKPGVSLFQCGWWGLGLSIITSDTAFSEVVSGMVVDGSICLGMLPCQGTLEALWC